MSVATAERCVYVGDEPAQPVVGLAQLLVGLTLPVFEFPNFG